MPRYIAILFALPLLLSCSESAEAKLLAQKKAEEIELENARKAKVEFETKLKAEYEKKFGVPISDFELSIKNVAYRNPEISITRTATGAIAEYGNNQLEMKLDISEWLDFINALRKYNINEKKTFGSFCTFCPDDRELRIQFFSSDDLVFAFDMYSRNWADVIKIMDTMIARIKREGGAKLETKLKYEYEKRFGVPISDFELSISYISFIYSRKPLSNLEMNATRTINGARIRYYVDYEQRNTTGFYDESRFGFDVDLELDIGEWLDFVNALNKCNIGKWKKDYSDRNLGYYKPWNLRIYSLGKEMLISRSRNGVPSNWDEFIKIIESFGVKAREKAVEKADSIRKAKL